MRRTISSMTDAELAAEATLVSATPGRRSAARHLAILDEQISREGGWPLGFALVHPTLSSREYTPVRIIKAGKRFTEVETMHERPEDRMTWRETSRGLWTFATEEECRAELEKLYQSAREYAAQMQANAHG